MNMERGVERQRQYARKIRCGERAHLLSSPPRSLLETREPLRALCTGYPEQRLDPASFPFAHFKR